MSENTSKCNPSFKRILPNAEEASTNAHVNSCRHAVVLNEGKSR